MIALLLAALAAPAARAQVEASVPVVARFELTGPLEDPELGYGESRTLVRGALLRSERRTLEVPFLPPRFPSSGAGSEADAPGLAVGESDDAQGAAERVRFLGWVDSDRGERWRRLPRGLVTRPVPIPTELEARPRSGGVATLLAGGIVVLLLRSRPRAALAAGLVCAGLVASPLAVLAPRGAGAVVLEGEASGSGATRFVRVDVRRDRSECAASAVLALSVRPRPTTPADVARLELDLDRPERWRVRAAGRRIVTWLRGPGGARLLPDENTLADLEAVWVRSGAGPFVAHGPWDDGAPFPPAVPESRQGAPVEPPPGWLSAGLPPGVGVLVGRTAPASAGSPERAWVRLSGFPLRPSASEGPGERR